LGKGGQKRGKMSGNDLATALGVTLQVRERYAGEINGRVKIAQLR